jgi:hypothetical protein
MRHAPPPPPSLSTLHTPRGGPGPGGPPAERGGGGGGGGRRSAVVCVYVHRLRLRLVSRFYETTRDAGSSKGERSPGLTQAIPLRNNLVNFVAIPISDEWADLPQVRRCAWSYGPKRD